ncbi:unnamed protein product [Linum trigynum]|uniref:Uncharacterized protein n=1 Tax=Linum trigynum TaxID=586398 RepID=A0AAV2GIJ4_9ROSI
MVQRQKVRRIGLDLLGAAGAAGAFEASPLAGAWDLEGAEEVGGASVEDGVDPRRGAAVSAEGAGVLSGICREDAIANESVCGRASRGQLREFVARERK